MEGLPFLFAISDTTACIVYNERDNRNNFVYFKLKEVSMRIGIYRYVLSTSEWSCNFNTCIKRGLRKTRA